MNNQPGQNTIVNKKLYKNPIWVTDFVRLFSIESTLTYRFLVLQINTSQASFKFILATTQKRN
jgi:hypothetical protein